MTEKLAYRFLTNMFSIPSYGIEVVLRHSFGQRYFNIPIFLATLFTVFFWNFYFEGLAIILGWFGGNFNYEVKVTPAIVFATLVLILGGYHIFVIYERNAQGERWHSRSGGISYLTQIFPDLNPRLTQLVVEPALAFAVGLVIFLIRTVDNSGSLPTYIYPLRSLGLFLMLAGVSLFNKEYLYDLAMKNRYLDAIDSQIENKLFKQLLDQGWQEFYGNKPPPPQQTQGFTARVPHRPQTEKQYRDFQEMIAGLDPDLKDFYEQKKQQKQDQPTDGADDPPEEGST